MTIYLTKITLVITKIKYTLSISVIVGVYYV